ncbi:unnamed protein product [Periconia digitata]|uniref:Uncharacterized protein n=1 Tax=Periconia digitata TaxID=1303443 RepID=A0A9W4U2Y6_9PLEO|nr:unnamed protein product [Periconia digitata]
MQHSKPVSTVTYYQLFGLVYHLLVSAIHQSVESVDCFHPKHSFNPQDPWF